MNWRSTQRTLGSRADAVNFRSNNAEQRGFGGGDFIKSLNPIFYIKDLTVIQNGYFVDSSGNNKQIQAATTTVTNDSLIMPANDSSIISALTAAGCYSQFYTDNATPKKVLLSNISPCYNDYSYFGYIEKKNFFLCASSQSVNRDKILNIIKLHICAFNSIQGGAAAQVSGTYQCYAGKLAYVDYGNWGGQAIQKVNATATDHIIASTGYLANTTYRIQLFSALNDNGFKKIKYDGQTTVSGFNISCTPKLLDELYLYNTINNMGNYAYLSQSLTRLTLSGMNKYMFGSLAQIPRTVKYLYIYDVYFNASNLSDLPQTVEDITLINTNNISGLIESIPSSINNRIDIRASGTAIDYNGGILPSWGSVTITIQTVLTTAMVDSFLINWATTAGTGTKTINLAGSNQPHSSSDPEVIAAKTTLQSKGKTLILN